MPTCTTKLLVATSLLLLIGITVSIAWIGKIYFFDLPDYEAYVVNTYKTNQRVGRSFPAIPVQTAHGDTVYTDFTGTKGSIVLLFDPFASCQPCLQLVLKTLQHLYGNLEYPNQLPIYAISNAVLSEVSPYWRALNLKYPLGIPIQSEEMDDLFEWTPIIFLIDSNNTIIQCHHPLFEKEQFTTLFFYELVFNYLPALKVNTKGFEDSPLNVLHGVSLLEVIKGHHTFESPF